MHLALKEGVIKGEKANRQGPQISHLLFADDCVLFDEAIESGAQILQGILKEYESCSG